MTDSPKIVSLASAQTKRLNLAEMFHDHATSIEESMRAGNFKHVRKLLYRFLTRLRGEAQHDPSGVFERSAMVSPTVQYWIERVKGLYAKNESEALGLVCDCIKRDACVNDPIAPALRYAVYDVLCDLTRENVQAQNPPLIHYIGVSLEEVMLGSLNRAPARRFDQTFYDASIRWAALLEDHSKYNRAVKVSALRARLTELELSSDLMDEFMEEWEGRITIEPSGVPSIALYEDELEGDFTLAESGSAVRRAGLLSLVVTNPQCP